MLLEEAPIAVDSFGATEPGTLYFCTHVHEDHLKGLHASWQRGFVYCSPITARILAARWPGLASRLRPLELGVVHNLSLGVGVGEVLRLEVLLIDAHHVLGSVMFVFSGYFGTVLHTGDFRADVSHAHLGALPMIRGNLSRVYLDSTFCHPRFQQPPREEVIDGAVNFARSRWPCIIYIAVYQLGKEMLLRALGRHLGTRVLMSAGRFAALSVAGDVEDDIFQPEPSAPKDLSAEERWKLGFQGCIWAVPRKDLRPLVASTSAHGVPAYGLLPSGWCQPAGVDEDDDDDDVLVHKLPYSDHCSFLELVQFLSWLPLAPVTLLTPLARPGGAFGYDGAEGMRQLLELSGAPSVVYQDALAAAGAPRRRRRTIAQCKKANRLRAEAARVWRQRAERRDRQRERDRRKVPCPGLRMTALTRAGPLHAACV